MTREPGPALSARLASVRKVDVDYVRDGAAEIFMAIEPLGCMRYVRITKKPRRRYQ